MSTRATITFVDGNQELVKLYNHWDGYIEGLGYDIANWLLKKRIVNGISMNDTDDIANGVGCLVAQFIRDFKEGAGGLYVEPLNSSNEYIDYNYRIMITPIEGTQDCNRMTQISVTCWDNEKPIFVGSPRQLLHYKEETEVA